MKQFKKIHIKKLSNKAIKICSYLQGYSKRQQRKAKKKDK